MSSFALIVNGETVNAELPPDMPLLWALRDVLGLTGTKFGCGTGLCGACTVHVDGEVRQSCILPVSEAAGRHITTIEAFTASKSHPVQHAWIDENVPQCGYCQPGQIMAAIALLAQHPTPTDDEINAAMAGNLCRCGTYQRIRRAIHRASGQGAAAPNHDKNQPAALATISPRFHRLSRLLPLAGALGIAGLGANAQVSRRSFLKVSAAAGAGLLITVSVPGCRTPPVEQSPPSATPTVGPLPSSTSTITLPDTPHPSPIPPPAIATSVQEPEREEPPLTGVTTTATTPLPDPTSEQVPTGTPEPTAWFEPNVFLKIDTNGMVSVTVHRSEMGQGVRTALAMIVAEELEADWSKIHVEQAPADPRYGNQDTHGSESMVRSFAPLRQAGAVGRTMLISAAAKVWGIDRESCFAENGSVVHQSTGQRLSYGELAEVAATLPLPSDSEVTLKDPRDFRIIGSRMGGVDDGQIVNGRAVFSIDVQLPGMLFAAVARCPVFGGRVSSYDATNALTVAGVQQVLQIDAGVAVVADNSWSAIKGRDALEITWSEGSNATANSASVQQWFADQTATASSNSQGATLEAVYGMPFLAHATMAPMNCVAHVGADFCEVWAPTQRPAVAKQRARSITGLPDNAVTVHVPLLGGGFGRRREDDFVAEAVQISRDTGSPIKLIWTREDDIQHDYYHPLTYQRISARTDAPDQQSVRSSQTLPGIPTAAWRSATNLTPAFVRECFLDELAVSSGRDPYELRLSLPSYSAVHEVLTLAASQSGWGTPLSEGWGRGIAAYSTWGVSHVAEVVELSVDEEGSVRVHRVVCAIDCGIVINPDSVAAQMEGGIVYGLSAALGGEITIADGRVQQGNFHDYPVLRMDEMPLVEVHIVPSERPPQGAGEMSVPPIIPALLNAIFAATGKRIRRLPVRREALRGT